MLPSGYALDPDRGDVFPVCVDVDGCLCCLAVVLHRAIDPHQLEKVGLGLHSFHTGWYGASGPVLDEVVKTWPASWWLPQFFWLNPKGLRDL
jgi:hypothetical protein